MSAAGVLSGINLISLKDAFSGSEDILNQMLTLFDVQARERMSQLKAALGDWEVAAARQCMHSLVNISGAVHAYGMSEQTKALGDAVKADNRGMAGELLLALEREADLVLRQTKVLLAILAVAPGSVWDVDLPD
jgi:HPt (histidine-containing phosphotransfer) domain-containing protein